VLLLSLAISLVVADSDPCSSGVRRENESIGIKKRGFSRGDAIQNFKWPTNDRTETCGTPVFLKAIDKKTHARHNDILSS
jgi:hypothetical protein